MVCNINFTVDKQPQSYCCLFSLLIGYDISVLNIASFATSSKIKYLILRFSYQFLGFQFILQSIVAFPATLGLIRGAGNFDDILTLQNFSILSSFITFSWTCQTLRYSRERQKTSVFPSDFSFCLLMLCIIGASVKILDDSGCSLLLEKR